MPRRGVAPRSMKIGRRLGLYFRTKPSCHASGVTPPKMKTGTKDSQPIFGLIRHAPQGRVTTKYENIGGP